MTQPEDLTPEEGENTSADEQQPGPEADATGPEPHSAEEEPLTVEDILAEEQSEAARGADEAEAGDSDAPEAAEPDVADAPEDNPYLDDLRRLTAEYANYRKRTEDNRELEQQRAKATVIEPLLGVLDDLDRAEAHGDLIEGTPFLTIAQKIRATLEKMGLEAFGEKGEPFDPAHHEAIAQVPVPGTEAHTVLDVVERGYRIGLVELRPAKVAVAVNADG